MITRKLRMILLVFLSLSSITVVTPAHADLGDPSGTTTQTQWIPSGPATGTISMNTYAGAGQEFAALQGGAIDLTDVPLNRVTLTSGSSLFCPSSGFLCTSLPQNQPDPLYDVFGIDFNMNGNFWGINFNHGNDPAGRELRQGIAHLINKIDFNSHSILGGSSQRIDCFAPLLQRVPCNQPTSVGNIPAWTTCDWDPLYHTGAYTACYSAYNFGSSSNCLATGAVICGSPGTDFCAAADHFVNAFRIANVKPNGNPVTKDPSTCVLQNSPSGTLAIGTPIFDRTNSLVQLGLAMARGINALMNRTAATECSSGFASDTVLGADSRLQSGNPFNPALILVSNAASPCAGNWQMFTLGWILDSQFDQFYTVYNSKYAFNGYSNSTYDYWTNKLEFDPYQTDAVNPAEAAEYIMGTTVVDIPVWSDLTRFAYLKTNPTWQGIVDATGVGILNYWTALDAWNQNSNGMVRWGFSEQTFQLNPFTSTLSTERFVLGEIYDTLLKVGPYVPTTGPQIFGWMASTYNFVSNSAGVPLTTQDTNCPSSINSIAVGGCVKITLRGDISFQDGVQVTASDVKFSYENFSPIGVIDVVFDPRVLPTSLGGTESPGQPEILYIAVSQVSVFTANNVAYVPIVPQHLWRTGAPGSPTPSAGAACADTGIGASQVGNGRGTPPCMADPSFITGYNADPVVNNMLIGSGPFMCANASGVPGSGCTRTGSAASGYNNGAITLSRFGSGLSPQGATGSSATSVFFRTNADYEQFLWASQGSLGNGANNWVDGGAFAADLGCPTTPLSTICQHYDSPAGDVSWISSAGPFNPGYSGGSGLRNPTHSDYVGYASQIARWSGTFWNSPFAYDSLNGAIPRPVTIYEDGAQYTTVFILIF